MTRHAQVPPDPGFAAARLIAEAARSLSADPSIVVDAGRCLRVAAAMEAVLRTPGARRAALLSASPSIVERSGRSRTLVEMIESEGGDDAWKLRLARLLLRSLSWG